MDILSGNSRKTLQVSLFRTTAYLCSTSGCYGLCIYGIVEQYCAQMGKKGSRGIASIDRSGNNARLKYVFDISTSSTFKVSIPTIRAWEKEYKEEGDFKKKPLNRSYKKLNPEQLLSYIKEHPDAYWKEIGEAFG